MYFASRACNSASFCAETGGGGATNGVQAQRFSGVIRIGWRRRFDSGRGFRRGGFCGRRGNHFRRCCRGLRVRLLLRGGFGVLLCLQIGGSLPRIRLCLGFGGGFIGGFLLRSLSVRILFGLQIGGSLPRIRLWLWLWQRHHQRPFAPQPSGPHLFWPSNRRRTDQALVWLWRWPACWSASSSPRWPAGLAARSVRPFFASAPRGRRLGRRYRLRALEPATFPTKLEPEQIAFQRAAETPWPAFDSPAGRAARLVTDLLHQRGAGGGLCRGVVRGCWSQQRSDGVAMAGV